MKCEPQLSEQQVVEILMKNIHGPIAFFLKGFTIHTFDKLLNKAASLATEETHIRAFRDQSHTDSRKPQ